MRHLPRIIGPAPSEMSDEELEELIQRERIRAKEAKVVYLEQVSGGKKVSNPRASRKRAPKAPILTEEMKNEIAEMLGRKRNE